MQTLQNPPKMWVKTLLFVRIYIDLKSLISNQFVNWFSQTEIVGVWCKHCVYAALLSVFICFECW